MTRILGIDPGSRITGYGIIDMKGGQPRYLTCGTIRVVGETLGERLKVVFDGVSEVVTQYRPDELAIEKVFVQRNVDSALKLGQARGAAICAVVNHALPVFEYSPNQIKQAVVGKGHAAKEQVQHMVRVLLQLREAPVSDAADALGCALCHSQIRATLSRMNQQIESATARVRR